MVNPTSLQANKVYHIYNRGNNREDLFREERNYRYFMSLYVKYIEPIADTFAYCLLKNHFHVLVRIKDAEDIRGLSGVNHDPSKHFSNLFNAYARAFNKAYSRTGALFQRPFGRIEITDAVLTAQHTRIKRDEMLAWFGSRENLVKAHLQSIQVEEDIAPLLLEDLV